MTIEKGQPWGTTVDPPTGLRFIGGDSAVAAALTDGTRGPVAVTGGDLHRTVGGRNPMNADTLLELPVDLLRVTLDEHLDFTACAHVLIQSQRRRGGWWRGPVVMVMNAEFVGNWQVVARGHPNDGRAESCAWGADFSMRNRWEARRRLPGNQHVPHPLIETRSFRAQTWEFQRPMHVSVDGVAAGVAQRVDIVVEPDAATIYA